MSTLKTELRLTLTYISKNETTYAYTVDENLYDDKQAVKDRIRAFNQAAADTNSDVYKTFVDSEGANVEAITGAEIRTVESEVIYNG